MSKKIEVVFYMSSMGNEPVKEWLKSLNRDERQTIGNDIKTVEYGYPVGMPTSKSLGNKLHEVRSNLSDSKIARVIYVVENGYMILLNGFIKKTQATPKQEIDLALKRYKEIK